MIKSRFRFLYGILRSYLLILIPVLVVSFFVSGQTLNSLKDTTYRNVSAQISKVCGELDQTYISYTTSSFALATEAYQEGAFWDTNAHRYNVINVLNNANKYDHAAESILLYCNDGYLYTSSGLSSVENYLGITLKLTEASNKRMVNLLNLQSAAVYPAYTQASSSTGYLVLHFPVPENIATNHFSVNFMLDFSWLSNLLEPIASDCPVNICLTFADGNQVFISGDQTGLSVQSGDAARADGRFSTNISASAPAIGISMQVSYDSDQLYNTVRRNQQLSYLIIVLGMLASTGISIWFSKRRVNNVQKLKEVFDGKTVEFKQNDEFAFIGSMLCRSVSETNSLSSSIRSYRTTLKQQTMTMLLNGIIKDRSTVNQLLQACGIGLYEDYFFVGGIEMNASDAVFEMAMRLMSSDLICETRMENRRILVFLAELPNTDTQQTARAEMAAQLLEVLSACGAQDAQIGMSQVYQDLFMTEIAFHEVQEILAKPSVSKVAPVCFEQMIGTRDPISRLNQEQLKQFADCVEKHELQAADDAVSHLSQNIQYAHCTERNKAYLRYCILQTLLSALGSSGERSDNLLQDAMRMDMNDGANFPVELKRILHKYAAEPEKTVDFEAILSYIQQNYNNYNLSASDVAQFAGIDKSHLSRYFKSNIQMTYIDYLTKLRLEKAHDLLIHTQKPLTEIVTEIGYSDHSSFRRKFKAMYGYSATDCRAGTITESHDSAPLP